MFSPERNLSSVDGKEILTPFRKTATGVALACLATVGLLSAIDALYDARDKVRKEVNTSGTRISYLFPGGYYPGISNERLLPKQYTENIDWANERILYASISLGSSLLLAAWGGVELSFGKKDSSS